MKVGIPKEIKNNENRVGMTPAGVAELVKHGHDVYVQATAGVGSGFADDEYVKAGATMLPDIDWTQPVADIDQQLYKKYGLTKEEQQFIETMIKPM